MKKFVKLFLLFTIVFLGITATSGLYAQDSNDLYIYKEDLVVEERNGDWKTNGVDLYIRKKPGINSVLLCETTRDPSGKQDSFAYRAEEYNSVNGDEIRMLNGEVLKSKYSMYSLISSTVVQHPKLGECFHIYIPRKLVWGYPWERHGVAEIDRGLFINIRTFSKKYADYEGRYADNPFMFDYETLVKVSKKQKEKADKQKEEQKQKAEPEPVAEPETDVDDNKGKTSRREPSPVADPDNDGEPDSEDANKDKGDKGRNRNEPEPEPVASDDEQESAPVEPEVIVKEVIKEVIKEVPSEPEVIVKEV
ncbi:MAG: hypothetical protein IJU95_05440, partial [Treponema sp.]|nr:hypothetical protein [Treponema sp.]